MKVGEVVTIQLGPISKRHDTHGQVTKVNRRTFWVRLPDGNIVKRKIARDLASKYQRKATSESH